MAPSMDRRRFIELAGTAGVAIGSSMMSASLAVASEASGSASGASASASKSASASASGSSPASKSTSASTTIPAWLGEAPVIDAAAIGSTVDAEVVICGAGVAGLAAGLACIDNGVKPVVIEKNESSRIGGGVHAAVNTDLQSENGISFEATDIDKLIKAEMKNSGMNSEESLLRVWAQESGSVLNEIIGLVTATGIDSRINTLPLPDYDQEEEEYFTEGAYPVGHAVGPGDSNDPAINALTAKITDGGGTFYYSTAATELIQDDSGNVTGVYALGTDGKYIQFNASKGVIVTTGDYGANVDMVNAFVPQIANTGLPSFYTPAVNTGDGHKMMVWAGAQMQRAPHAPMTACTFLVPQPVPFLLVNINGERFQNEASSNFIAYNSVGHQPEMTAFQVFDSTWADACNTLKVMTWSNTYTVDDDTKTTVESGSLSADTLEELADKMGVPQDTFVATVNRRNDLADAGHDDDFGLPIDRLAATKIVEPPFYANQNVLVGYGVCLGGVWVNKQMQVLKPDGTPIPGLYAGGNTVGRRFGTSYFQELCGLSNGMADAHGYVAGREASTNSLLA